MIELKVFRIRNGWRQKDLIYTSGLTATTLSNIENGLRFPTMEERRQIRQGLIELGARESDIPVCVFPKPKILVSAASLG